MKLNEYISGLLELINTNPELGEIEVIYASDDEGNSYHNIHNSPTLVIVEDITQHYIEIEEDENVTPEKANAIIIN